MITARYSGNTILPETFEADNLSMIMLQSITKNIQWEEQCVRFEI